MKNAGNCICTQLELISSIFWSRSDEKPLKFAFNNVQVTVHVHIQHITHVVEECRIWHLKGDNNIMKRRSLNSHHNLLCIDLQTRFLSTLLPQEPLLWDGVLQTSTKLD